MNNQFEHLRRLEWDSRHFGFEVGAILAATMDDQQLAMSIDLAIERGFSLVYWATQSSRDIPVQLLSDLGGQLVDRKQTYFRELSQAIEDTASLRDRQIDGAFRLQTIPPGPASKALISLAIDASRHSRFRTDVHFPRPLADKLYATWVERSTLRQIADTVLAVVDPQDRPLGMVTVAKKSRNFQIGLIAVDKSVRRAGIGRMLMTAAHEWMIHCGGGVSTVVTQADNAAACQLYERCGYQVDTTEYVYHFWPKKK